MALSCSGTYKEYLETTEHIERDLQTFRDVTKELTYHMNTVGFISGLWHDCSVAVLLTSSSL